MPIQWFPGHMHATRQALAKRLPDIDVVLELLDARLPGSSANPLLAELIGTKPTLKVLNKQDLADAERTALWLAHYQAQPGTNALALDASDRAPAAKLVPACRALAPLRGGMVKPLRVLICGIPNVGKSTLINTLVGRRMAKASDEAGITKVEQRIALAKDFDLYDTPGMLWPRITVEQSGWHLAASGAVGKNAYDEVEVALHLLASVRGPYATRLQERYKLAAVEGLTDEELLTEVGRKRSALLPGGRVHLHKAAELALTDFSTGAWGRITLETPQDLAQWQADAAVKEEARKAKAAARVAKKLPQRGGPPAEDA